VKSRDIWCNNGNYYGKTGKKRAMARTNQGVVKQGKDELFYGRVRWTDEETGKPREKKFPPQITESEAWKLVHKFKDKLESEGTKAIDASNKTFEDLAGRYEKDYLIEARYRNGVKESGLRSLLPPQLQLKVLRDFFKSKRLKALTYSDIRRFREMRLKVPKRGGGERSIASVNRELALLRRILNVACHELRWISRNPFHDGKPLISIAAEQKRERILSRDEEQRLLEQCTGRRKHLKALIICLIDTGCRKGEILKMTWQDVNLETRELFIPMMNTKTARAKTVPVSNRMLLELERMWDESPQDPNDLVFGLKSLKRSFDTARSKAGIPEVRIHDLRHTYASRLAKNHMPIAELARMLGHATLEMSYRYINSDSETLDRARNIVNEFNAEPIHDSGSVVVKTEMVN
jgi:integrase